MKKSLCILLTVLFVLGCTPAVFADLWLPPINCDLEELPKQDGDCYVLNAFASCYGELGVHLLNKKADSKVYDRALLRHFELNPDLYPKQVSSFLASDGSRYMKIDGELYEKQMMELFGREATACAHPGYCDGAILVRAEHYGEDTGLYASARYCYGEDRDYFLYIEIYQCTDPAFRKRLETANCNLPDNRGTLIASGYLYFDFLGEEDATVFEASDFRFTGIRLDEIYSEFPPTAEYTPFDESLLPTVPERSEGVISIGRLSITQKHIFLAVGVLLTALLALGAILLTFRRKKK